MHQPGGSWCLFPILVMGREKLSHGSLRAEPFPSFFPGLWGYISPDPSWRWGSEPCLTEEEISPVFLMDISILFVHPGDEKTVSLWCGKAREE